MAQAEQLAAELVTKGLQKFESDMAKADRAVGKSADSIDEAGKSGIGFGDVLGGVAKGLGIATAAAATMGIVFKQAMDLGKAGATVVQATASFEGLVEQLELGADYMGRLEEAAGGTIDKLSLMAGVGTLLAGTSREFGRELAKAYPTLVTYARAAAKLNPHLGNTNQMLDSIALGLKRGSPMILDNLGLTIKIGDANEAFAQSLGKSVTELTAEEKQMALLNATMEAGNRLVEQVGGTVDSATDSFARWDAATKNLGDELKAKLAPSLSTAAEAATLLLTWSGRVTEALDEQEGQVILTSDSYIDYIKKMTDALHTAGRLTGIQAASIVKMVENGDTVDNLAERYGFATEAVFDHAKQTEDDRLQVEYHTGALSLNKDELEGHIEIVKSAAEEQWILAQRTEDDRLRTQDWTEALKIHEAAMAEDEKAVEAANEAYLAAEAAIRRAEVATGDYFTTIIDEAEPGTWDMAAAMWESADAADWDAQQMAILAGALGIYTDEQVEAALKAAVLKIKLDKMAESVADGSMTVRDAIAAFNDLKGAIDGIPEETHTTYTWSMPQGHPQAASAPAPAASPTAPTAPSGHPQGAYQHGAWNIPQNQMALLHAGEMVIPAQAAQQIRQVSTIHHHNYNLTAQSMIRQGGLEMEFAAMEMGSR